jgi:hypothetical protein
VLALTRLWQMFLRRAQPGLADLAWAAPGSLYVLLQGIQRVAVRGPAGGAADVSANLTWPFSALAADLDRDVHRMSWTHLGTYDYNVIEFLALMAFVVAVVLLLATPAGPVTAAASGGGHASLPDRAFAPDRAITSKHLAWLAAAVAAALLVVARRRVLFE